MKNNYFIKQFSKKFKTTAVAEKFSVIIFGLIMLFFGYASFRETFIQNSSLNYALKNSVVSSVLVAIDGVINPNGTLAAASAITSKIENGEGIIVEDVFRRSIVQSGDRSSPAFFQLYDTKAGINDGMMIDGSSLTDEMREYLRWNNRSSLDTAAATFVGIVIDGNPDVVADFIIKNNEDGFVPIIRLCLEQQGACPYILEENADTLVDFFTKVGDRLMAENKGYRAVVSLGPNEPHTGNIASIASSFGLAGYDYSKFVQRANQAADRLQKYRIVNGGVFWLAPAIFNGTESYKEGDKEYSYDVFHHLYIGGESTSKDYWSRPNIDPDLFDAMLVNVYSETTKTAYEFYRDFGLKDYVDKHANLVTVVTEFGIVPAPSTDAMTVEDIKDDFKQLCNDDKIEAINYFRGVKDKPAPDPAPKESQRLDLEELIKYTEQCNKTSKKINLKVSSWLNTNVDSVLYDRSSESSSESGSLNVTSKGGLNQADGVGGIQNTLDVSKRTGLKGYSLAIAYKQGDAGGTINFINTSIDQGFVPIVRLCVKEGGEACQFNARGGNASDIVNFYKAVRDGAKGTFIAILGANEPASESQVFGGASVADMARAAQSAAEQLGKSSKMLMAPAAFNLVNSERDEFAEYEQNGMKLSSFDVFIGNAYNMTGYTVDGAIDKVLNKVQGLKFILTETGNIKGQTSEDFAKTAASICKKIDGFLLFRVLGGDGDYPNKPEPFSEEKLKEISAACAGGSTTTTQVAEVTDTDDNTSPTPAGTCTGGLADNKILFVGDSLTNELVAGNSGAGVTAKFSSSKNLGTPGSGADWFIPGGQKDSDLGTALSDSNIETVVVMFGTNDCGGSLDQFKNNLTSVINNIKSKKSSVKIVLSTIPNAHKACSPSTIEQFNAAIKEVQGSTGAALRELGGSLFSQADLRDGDDRHLKDSAYTKIEKITRELLGATCPDSSNPGSGGGATDNYGAGSNALVCGVETDKPIIPFYSGKNAAGLRVKCEGGVCTTKKIGTIDIEAPIKQFSTSSPNGTLRQRFTPVSQLAASTAGDFNYDGLNMFAGEIVIGGKSYPMPGLGSAINSSSEILPQTMTERNIGLQADNSKGSLTQTTNLKLQSQVNDNSAVPVVGSTVGGFLSTNTFSTEVTDSNVLSIDDRTVCFDGRCFNNDLGLADWRKNLLPYDPAITYPSYIAPKVCENTKMKFINNLDNYITGPEMVVEPESTVFSGSPQSVCGRYSSRNLPGSDTSGDGVKTCGYIFDTRQFSNANVDALSPDSDKPLHRVYETIYDPLSGGLIQTSRIEYGNWTCKELFDGQANPNDGVEEDAEFANAPVPDGARLPKCDFDDYEFDLNKGKIDPAIRSGSCKIPERYWEQCLRYDPQASDQVYIHTEAYPTISKARIPGVYSSIFTMYDRLQTILSQRSMKIVLPENMGAKLKVNAKIRDANEPIAQQEYKFSRQSDNYSYLPELFDNSVDLSQNNSTKTEFQYYDDLGYLDILQEYLVAYAGENTLLGDHVIDNPFEGAANPLPGRQSIVVGGLSNVGLGNSVLLTCDQVEICKKYTQQELAQTFGSSMAKKLCPLIEEGNSSPLIPANAQKNCITNIGDNRYTDRLGDTLCARGFKVRSGCTFQCDIIDDGQPTGPLLPSGSFSCPVQTTNICVQGPGGLGGTSSHGSLNAVDIAGGPNLVAPFDGRIVRTLSGNEFSWCKNGAAAGGAVFYEGNVGGKVVGLFFYHINITTISKNQFKAGEVIGKLSVRSDSDMGSGACWGGVHTHVEFADLSGDFANLSVSAVRSRLNKGDRTSSCLNNLLKFVGCNMGSNPSCKTDGAFDLSCVPSYGSSSSSTGETTDGSYPYDILYPVSKARQILNCAEPQTVVQVNAGIPVYPEDSNFTGFTLIPEAKTAFEEMMNAMKAQNQEAFSDCGVAWGYRDAELQGIYSYEDPNGTARKCHSEHQLGTTVDFRTSKFPQTPGKFAGSACESWLKTNADKYGWIRSYDGTDPDYNSEAWHYRYIGKEKAAEYKSWNVPEKFLRKFLEGQGAEVIIGGGGGSTGGGTSGLQCFGGYDDGGGPSTGPRPTGGNDYKNLYCLIKDVTEYTSSHYKNGQPAWSFAATMDYEAGRPFIYPNNPANKADPAMVINDKENWATAMGPLQITRGAWNRIVENSERRQQVIDCAKGLGLKVTDLRLEDRAVLGIAMCASSIFQLYNVDIFNDTLAYQGVPDHVTRHLGSEYLDNREYLVPPAQWTEMQSKINTYKYFGACKVSIQFNPYTGGPTNDYCETMWRNGQVFKKIFDTLDCNSDAAPPQPNQM